MGGILTGGRRTSFSNKFLDAVVEHCESEGIIYVPASNAAFGRSIKVSDAALACSRTDVYGRQMRSYLATIFGGDYDSASGKIVD